MRKFWTIVYPIMLASFFVWACLTIYVQRQGPALILKLGDPAAAQTALIIYDPDPFYDLDAQVCQQFAEGFLMPGWKVEIATVRSMANRKVPNAELLVFCANTYNWAPDRACLHLVKKWVPYHDHQPIVNITLGAGSTHRAQRLLDEAVNHQGGNLIASRSYWLMRPNDETRMTENNVDLAKRQARLFGAEVALVFTAGYSRIHAPKE